MLVLLGTWPFGQGVADAAGSSVAPSPASTSTTTTLPPVPKVSTSITDGQSTQTLLSNAITLVSVGVDTSALQAGIDITQQKLDQDAVTGEQMIRQAAAADQRAAGAREQAQTALENYQSLNRALQSAVVFLYTSGPASLTVNSAAGDNLAFAVAYADTAITPNGLLSVRRYDVKAERRELAVAKKAQKSANRALAKATKAMAAESAEQVRLEAELKAVDGASATEVAADHATLATQAGAELLSSTALQFTPKTAIPAPLSTTAVELEWAFSELGKNYVWGATGPNTFDCSGLTQYVWRQSGVSIPRVAAEQYAWTIPVPLSQLLPGDLVFFGRTDIHHVGIYIGDGLMINAPHTGTVVQVSSIWWSDLAGFGRVHAPGTPVPLHQPPSVQKPAPPLVVATAGPVPSQKKPPPGWKPTPGSSTPLEVYPPPPAPGSSSPSTTTTTIVTSPSSTTTTTTTIGATTTTTTGSTTTTTTLPVGAGPLPTSPTTTPDP
jgi:cell wall-associated NlpC family hydrolase